MFFLYNIIAKEKIFSAFSPIKMVIYVPGKVVYLDDTTVYCACLCAGFVDFGFD